MVKTSLPPIPTVQAVEPPHSMDVEQAVLGGLMLDNDRWDDVALILSETDFFSGTHRFIYRQMRALVENRQPIDLLTLSQTMEQLGEQHRVDFAYLAELSKNTPSAANIDAYAGHVARYAGLRQLQKIGLELTGRASLRTAEPEDVQAVAQAALEGVSAQYDPEGMADIPSLFEDVVGRVQELSASGGAHLSGVSFGLNELDKMTTGAQDGDLIIVAARPSMGKTAFGLGLGIAALETTSAPVQIYSLEMPKEQLMLRFIAILGKVPLQNLRSGAMSESDWERVASVAGKKIMDDWPERMLIDDTAGLSPSLLRTRARKARRQYGDPSLILVDYLQLMQVPELSHNRTLEISDISRSLKGLAKEMGCPVVALSQLNRGLESRADKRPKLSDLRESGAIEQDADLVMFIYRDEVYDEHTLDKGMAEIILGKQRNGPIGTVKASFIAEQARFASYDLGY
ncbi:replicative DNA helicase [Serratia fonticola]|uniref:replicative DNA helicase n=1 Tax=Serratia fonticola TaxID=47917 RepID=UPI0008FD2C0E|nr:replicative DNA helicase [Serratia fonticola]OIX93126.1 replicative DNA helicase [Serratia fonticola]QCR63061.1 replicative DNA helicase [Serratia fonticola]